MDLSFRSVTEQDFFTLTHSGKDRAYVRWEGSGSVSGKPIFLKIRTVIKYWKKWNHWKKCFLKGIKSFMRNGKKWLNIL